MKISEKHSFTLIELLVVIAIIAILAGMLLPALNSSREKGRTSDCLSRTKQYASVVLMYCDDYYPWVPGGYTIGHHRLNGKLNYESYFVSKLAELYKGAIPTVNPKNKFWFCPSLSGEAMNALMNGTKVTSALVHTYGINVNVRANDYRGRISLIKSPAKCAAVGDTILKDNAKGSYGSASIGPAELPTVTWKQQFRHGSLNSANYAFFDGHAETRRNTEVPTVYLDSSKGETMKYTLFWQYYTPGNNEWVNM